MAFYGIAIHSVDGVILTIINNSIELLPFMTKTESKVH